MRSKSAYDASLFLNRCEQCGGLWLEGLALYQITKREVGRIESLPKGGAKQQSFGRPLTCPQCLIRLSRLDDPNVPPEISVKRCSECKGVWVDSGDLLLYKKYQDNRKRKSRVTQLRYELSKEESVALLFVLFLILVLPAAVYLTGRKPDSVGRAIEMQEETRIERVTVSQVNTDSATLSWWTSRKATSQVMYGGTEEYGNLSVLDLKFLKNHKSSLIDLQPGKLYHFKVISQDEDGRIVESGDYTFVTRPQ